MEYVVQGYLWVVFTNMWLAAYWTPTIVGLARQVPDRGSVATINGLLGWTVVGWVVALAMAVRTKQVMVTVAG